MPPNLPVSYQDIVDAARVLDGKIVATPTIPAGGISADVGTEVALKLENLQRTGSFKDRGSYLRLSKLDADQKARGVIAMSAGNHAQGVAYNARRLGIPATIVMPEGTPFTKIERTRSHGAKIVLTGETLQECKPETERLAAEQGLTLIHPYDDPVVVAGQGTVGLEMLTAEPDLDVIVVPIGGGGIGSGVAIAAKSIKPGIEVIGVEVEAYPSMYQAIHKLPPTSGGPTIAEGIAVKGPGAVNIEICSALLDDILMVSETEIECAIQLLVESQKVVAEGAGAAGIAALLAHSERFHGKRTGVVICGGNIDSRILSSILLRGLSRDGRLVRLRVEITDRPGVMAQIAFILGEAGTNIVEVQHQRLFVDLPIKRADLDFVIETRNADHVQEVLEALTQAGFSAQILPMGRG
ncbi:MAG: threonine ammonia-lyase [Alphaproteobacteria bacterium]|nr:threonine ammonia-lyase [Alphaproteobacteria bacterium]